MNVLQRCKKGVQESENSVFLKTDSLKYLSSFYVCIEIIHLLFWSSICMTTLLDIV